MKKSKLAALVAGTALAAFTFGCNGAANNGNAPATNAPANKPAANTGGGGATNTAPPATNTAPPMNVAPPANTRANTNM